MTEFIKANEDSIFAITPKNPTVKQDDEWRTESSESKKYYQVRNAYLANGLAFLGYRFLKYGYGKDTVYSFENTHGIQDAVEEILALKKRVGLY